MVSWEMRMESSSPKSAARRPAICWGEYNASRSAITRRHNRGLAPNLVAFGRRAATRQHAGLAPADSGPDLPRPPLPG
jgi:hypothetical protein